MLWIGLYSEFVHGSISVLLSLGVLRLILGTVSISSRHKYPGVLPTIGLLFSFGYLSHVFADWAQWQFGVDWF